MKTKIILHLVLLIPSLCFVRKFVALKDPDYKNLQILVVDISTDQNISITKEEIYTEIKLLCLSNGIKASIELKKPSKLYVNLTIMKAKNL